MVSYNPTTGEIIDSNSPEPSLEDLTARLIWIREVITGDYIKVSLED